MHYGLHFPFILRAHPGEYLKKGPAQGRHGRRPRTRPRAFPCQLSRAPAEAPAWRLLARASCCSSDPPERIARLAAAVRAVLAPGGETARRFTEMGARIVNAGPEEAGAFIRTEIAKWAEVVRRANIRPE